MVVVTLNIDLCKDDIMIKFVKDIMVVFVFVMMSQMILNQAGWMVDTSQVGSWCPSSFFE